MTGPGPTGGHGGRVLVDQLRRHGVDMVFTVPGESFLAVLDALYDEPAIRTVVCRHEAGAGIMAEAHARLRGDVGVAFVTRGPGATHASVAVHNAAHSGAPLVLFVGQAPVAFRGRGAFQEMDLEAFFAPLAKWAVEVNRPEDLGEVVATAIGTARRDPGGPVVVSLPEDVLAAVASGDAPTGASPPPPKPDSGELGDLQALLAGSRRPLVMVGGGRWSATCGSDLITWAERNRLPVAVSFRRQDYLDNRSECYVGWAGVGLSAGLADRITEADLIIAIGTRLGDATTRGYTLLQPPKPRQKLVHILSDRQDLGRVYRPTLSIWAGAPETIAALAGTPTIKKRPWEEWTRTARAEYLATLSPPPAPGPVDLGRIVTYLDERLPPESVVTNGAGNFSLWPQRYYRFKRYGTQLGPQSGAMGYAIPAAVAAKLHRPDVPVVAFSGDGDFLMTAQELATSARYEAPIVVVVINNGMFATIRMYQERTYPGRPHGTDLVNPDFAAYARAFGGYGATVERTEDFPRAFEPALAAGVPAVLDLRVDPEAILPHTTLGRIRSRSE